MNSAFGERDNMILLWFALSATFQASSTKYFQNGLPVVRCYRASTASFSRPARCLISPATGARCLWIPTRYADKRMALLAITLNS
jgi:hypothetical protein